jgi:hypothetical protein
MSFQSVRPATVVKPKLLSLHAPTIRNQRTLIWLQDQSTHVPWTKWDAIVDGVDAYYKWLSYATIVGMVLKEVPNGDKDEFLENVYTISKKVPMILVSQAVLSLKSEEYWKDNFDNLVHLDTVLDQYPIMNDPWDGSIEDAIAIFALLCRYNRIIDCEISLARIAISNSMITVEHNSKPNSVWLITQYYHAANKARTEEIKECLRKNCECPYIDTIVLINERDYSKDFATLNVTKSQRAKIKQIVSGKRLMYSDFLAYVHQYVPLHTFTILANSDIYFGDSLLDLWKIDLTDKMMALLRWDCPADGSLSTIFGPRADSQDSWIFLSNSIKSRSWDYSLFRFQLGQAGCDNAFAGHMLRNRFVLLNPALTFKTYHLHNSDFRTYDKDDYIRTDLYINIVPTYIIDTKQEQVPPKFQAICNEVVSFEVKSSSLSNEITYCTMLEKEGRYKWEASVENFYFEPAIPVYSWKKSCVTPNGLVYDLYHIYTGKHMEEFNYWKTTDIDIFTPLQKCKRMFAIPFADNNVFLNPDTYILQYLSRCTRLLRNYPGTSFWIPMQFQSYLDTFTWDTALISGLERMQFDENTACWAEEVVGFVPSALEFGREDMSALRGILPAWSDKATGLICVVVVDHKVITHEFADKISAFFLKKDEWTIRITDVNHYAKYDDFIGASLCIFAGGKKCENVWAKLWALPRSCCVIEFQQELRMDGEFQHMAHVCDFKSWVLLLSKGTTQDVHEQIMKGIEKWYSKNEGELMVGPDF